VHRLAGGVFVCAMLAMGLSGAGIAAATTVVGSLIGGLLASYLVLSGFAIVRPPTPRLRRATLVAASLALPLGVGCAALGVVTLAEGSWVRDDVPVPMIFLFAAVALGAAAGDLRRVRVGGPVRGRRKIAAHLWRMCFALFIASGSFFLGQADEIPRAAAHLAAAHDAGSAAAACDPVLPLEGALGTGAEGECRNGGPPAHGPERERRFGKATRACGCERKRNVGSRYLTAENGTHR
jgi:hypothetical protein